MLTIKEKIGTFEYIKIKKFCPLKDTIKRVKRKVRVGKAFATHTSNKRLISRMCKDPTNEDAGDRQPNKKLGPRN